MVLASQIVTNYINYQHLFRLSYQSKSHYLRLNYRGYPHYLHIVLEGGSALIIDIRGYIHFSLRGALVLLIATSKEALDLKPART